MLSLRIVTIINRLTFHRGNVIAPQKVQWEGWYMPLSLLTPRFTPFYLKTPHLIPSIFREPGCLPPPPSYPDQLDEGRSLLCEAGCAARGAGLSSYSPSGHPRGMRPQSAEESGSRNGELRPSCRLSSLSWAWSCIESRCCGSRTPTRPGCVSSKGPRVPHGCLARDCPSLTNSVDIWWTPGGHLVDIFRIIGSPEA